MKCPIFWGSHGCDLEAGDDHEHLCMACCVRGADDSLPRHEPEGHKTAPDDYGFDGCAGAWPYYGSKCMAGESASIPFFRYEGPDWQLVYLPEEFDRMKELHERANQ